MELLGWLATVVVGIAVIVAIFVAVSAAPDFNRYRRLRKM